MIRVVAGCLSLGEDFEENLKELISKIPDDDIMEIGEILIKHDEIDKFIDVGRPLGPRIVAPRWISCRFLSSLN